MSDIAPFEGFGLGLRRPHYSDFLDGDVLIDFVEVISENYMVDGGKPLDVLTRVREKHPVALHGVSMSVGSAQRLDRDHLAKLKQLADRVEPLWVSDHLCWTRTSAHNSHDLLPLPYIEEALDVVCANISEAQDALGRPMLFENPSSYCSFPDNEMEEWEFLAEMTRRTGCYLLLDINNIYVSAHNHGFDAMDYLRGLPLDRVRQVHLAGHTPGEILIDTHDRPVCDGVWQLYAQAVPLLGEVATMIERDDDIPSLEELLDELDYAHAVTMRARQGEAA
ncbi:MAG: DUF692 domain-containing protein [Sphingomonadaceae bacterium]|nr:DUF692 domain-containing protein [Sphingomonadaceae bacterium]